MDEFMRFLLISNVSLLLVWLCYALIFRGTTFHWANRLFLLGGSVVSLLIPFMDIGSTATQQFAGVELPTFEVGTAGSGIASVLPSINVVLIAYLFGVAAGLWMFLRSIKGLRSVIAKSSAEVLSEQLVYRSDEAGPFSFLSIIHLPKSLLGKDQETILQHEVAHVRLGHSYDVLWLAILRIVFWFNPLLLLYQRSIREIHEYQADALTYISFSKEHYVKVQLNQLFELPSELSFANSFYNSINLKDRGKMIHSEKTSKWGGMRFLFVIPLAVTIGLLAACTEIESEIPTTMSETDKKAFSSMIESAEGKKVYKETEVMPEFPGGMQELFNYIGTSIKYPESAKFEGIEGKVFVQFVVDREGQITKAEVLRGVNEALDAEALRVVSEMPNWTPGKQDGNAVNVEMVLPIAYKLD